MSYVEKRSPFSEPNYDSFQAARRSDPLGLVEGVPLSGGKHYVPWIGLTTVRELALKYADKLDLAEGQDLRDLRADLTLAEDEAAQLRERVAELEASEARVAGLVADSNYKLVRKSGRLPRNPEEAKV